MNNFSMLLLKYNCLASTFHVPLLISDVLNNSKQALVFYIWGFRIKKKECDIVIVERYYSLFKFKM